MDEIKLVKDFYSSYSVKQKIRQTARNAAIRILSLKKNIAKTKDCIQFPYYHHVFDDEKKGFENQLKYLKNFGEFISIDQASDLLNGDTPINGRYFCVLVDDGFRSTYNNMLEITTNLDVPVIIYIPTGYIGLKEEIPRDFEKIKQFHIEDPKFVSFLSWSECLEMTKHNVIFGSHTHNHVKLGDIEASDIETEMKKSKEIIEKHLMIPCRHFACPWGRSGIDFDPVIVTEAAKKSGFKSLATTNRGIMEKGDDLFHIKRHHLLANWGNHQLKYFLGHDS